MRPSHTHHTHCTVSRCSFRLLQQPTVTKTTTATTAKSVSVCNGKMAKENAMCLCLRFACVVCDFIRTAIWLKPDWTLPRPCRISKRLKSQRHRQRIRTTHTAPDECVQNEFQIVVVVMAMLPSSSFFLDTCDNEFRHE